MQADNEAIVTVSPAVHVLPLPPPEPTNSAARMAIDLLLVACGVPLLAIAIVVPIVTMARLVRSLLPVAP